MVKIMVAPDLEQQPAVGEGHRYGWQVAGITGGLELCNALSGKDLPMDPSTCIFWCAVALGAFVRGSPIETVSRV